MSNRKRKQRPPERFSEDKRAELTWNMLDFHLPASGSTYQTTMNCIDSSSVNDETNTPTASSPRKKKRQKAFDRNRSIELNLENSYPQTCVCQLGLFNINLCTSETQRDELKSQNGTGISDDLWTVDCYHCVVIKLSFEPQYSIKDDKNLFELNNGCLRHASFKATVPSVSTHQLEALVYLQNKGVISLVLKPEQHILKESWEVVVCLKENGLTEMSSACADVKNRKIDQLMKVLIEWFYNISARGDDSVLLDCNNAGVDKGFDELYNAIKAVRESNCSSTSVPRSSLSNTPLCHVLDIDKDNSCACNAEINRCNGANDFDVQHPHLRPVLRGYQRRAVEWMLQRELAHQVTCGCQRKEIDAHSLHPLWQKIHSLDGKMIYYSPYTGRLTKERFCQPSLPLGGILADEMGLGKTVEVIACILCHSKPSSEVKSIDYTLTASEPHIDTWSTCNSMIQEGSKSKLAECENNDCDEAVTGHSSNKEPTLCENSPPLCNGDIAREMKGTTEKGYSSSYDSGHSTTSSNEDVNELALGTDGQKMAKTSSVIYTSDEESATQFMKCQCICGVNLASVDDKLLQCCECQAVFHATCLGYDYPGGFLCPHCSVSRPATPSRATLIISPAPIAQQWVEEISKHTQPSTVKLLVYEGVAKMGFIPPQVLADHDVILTTYSTLRSDFYHLGSKQGTGGRSMRYEKRYVALPSPLTAVLFWRICLDEAQMVESTTAKAAEVALCLHSVHKWCVTGTPIQKGLEDIHGLLLFLGVDPYSHQKWWKSLLFEPYRNGDKQPLYELLAKILWRSVKKDVIHEIQLPEQDEKVKWLTFSPVEQHFYHRQHEECANTAMKMLSHWERRDTMLSAIDRNTVHLLLNPLLRLRQACCHPQAVRGGFLSMQKSTLTMDKLLESLIAKAKLECEEAHRQLLFAFNGLAGIHILKEEWPEAVEMYREATRSWTEHEETFRTDALQKLHTLFNLSDVLSQQHPGCSHTLRDDKLPDDVKELKNAYTTRVNLQVDSAKQNLDAAQSSHAETRQKVDMQSPWWVEALHSVAERGLDTDLCQRVQDELSSTDMDLGSIGRFKDLHGLQYIVSSKLELIESTHSNLLVSLDKLSVPATPQMVLASAECCLRPAQNSTAERCAFCQVDDIFTEYESRIFGHQGMKGVDEHNSQTDDTLDWHRHGNTGGLRAESEVEKVLKVIHYFIKTHKTGSTAHLQQEGRLHLSLIDGLRKEFKFLRALWFALRERISCLDELDMCTTRLRLLLPGEPVTDDIHVIHPLQIEQQRLKFMSDRVVAQTELRKKLGQLLYLKNLAKTQTSHDGKNPEPCPVCTKLLGVQWSVFSCGHCICCRCSWVLLRQAGIGPRHRNVHVKCPMCRIPTLAQEISYVSTGRSQEKDTEENVTVKGSHSTKLEAVVRTLLAIKSADNTAKSLVFSTWQEVLSVLAQALDENGIKYKHITGSRLFQSNLQTFKQDSSVGVLLLPLQTGSNGLNIIEATHVLLVEPAMNPAHELQAVGRVHRIGQTKPTHVYRFIIQGTVESRMYSLLQSKPTSCVRTGARDSENASLTLSDLASLFTQDEERDEEQGVTGSFLFYEPTDALSPD